MDHGLDHGLDHELDHLLSETNKRGLLSQRLILLNSRISQGSLIITNNYAWRHERSAF